MADLFFNASSLYIQLTQFLPALQKANCFTKTDPNYSKCKFAYGWKMNLVSSFWFDHCSLFLFFNQFILFIYKKSKYALQVAKGYQLAACIRTNLHPEYLDNNYCFVGVCSKYLRLDTSIKCLQLFYTRPQPILG